jgi:hypothetical protein
VALAAAMGLQVIGEFFARGFKRKACALSISAGLFEVLPETSLKRTHGCSVDLQICPHPGLKYFPGLACRKFCGDH